MDTTDVHADTSPCSAGAAVPQFVADAIASIPPVYTAILRYILRFNADRGHKFRTVINGGFVRDMMRNKPSDDLDVSWDTRLCAKGTTTATLLQDLAAYSESLGQQRDGICKVELIEIVGDVDKMKHVDVTKAVFVFEDGSTIVVDVMPLLSIHGASSKVRPEQDAKRRDLTINALLMEVALPTADTPGTAEDDLLRELLTSRHQTVHAKTTTTTTSRNTSSVEQLAGDSEKFPFAPCGVDCHDIRWTLLDFVDGFADLMERHILQPPTLCNAQTGESLSDVVTRGWAQLLTQNDFVEFSRQLYCRVRGGTTVNDTDAKVILDAESAAYVHWNNKIL